MNSVTLIGTVERAAKSTAFVLSVDDVLIPIAWASATDVAEGERLVVQGSLRARTDGSVEVGAAAVHRLPSNNMV